ncbi:MAG TPA: uracil-DNA glycosylase [Bacteroidales bacterium]|nr:uracil-DNA glycosylase [Bacteroidales bacterium]
MDEFELLKQEVETCTKCNLCKTRNKVVFGEGFRNSKIMCIGEGPGYYEDQQGRPFVGKSGQLLDIILDVCGFNRNEHVFIGNIVKCRPPNNRDPLPEERETCIPYLYIQIELIDPKIIILLGATALKGLIDPNAKITKVRGEWLEWQNRLVMPTFHPSALLRNEKLKRPAWEDFKKVVAKYREVINPNHISDYC